ncbi:hypothetical protein [Mycobacterium sp. 852002-51057_SCH5723018]|uniref:hypothetical protein n=1 Tax=Mycobacterium sp. 852002-51057_SCH5723018 TaxID=1834094 RepID=UPI0012E97922|nr:hypothetical protein [Mycobacterium sp. 852002-51057_SCH5723018]
MACTNTGGWDIILAANDFSVLAGVLAGFVITAATILFASSSRYAPHTLGLFAAGVPVLALSSYIFSAISGVERESGPDKAAAAIADKLRAKLPDNPVPNPDQCAQVWSQGLVATAMLTVGGAVLICGLGWVLVTYAEELRITLWKEHAEYTELAKKVGISRDELKLGRAISDPKSAEPIIVKRKKLLVSLNGWFFAAATMMAGGILICSNMVYTKSGYLNLIYDSFPSKVAIFFIVGFGLFLMVRAAYTVIRRTSNALRHAEGGFDARRKQPTRRPVLYIYLTIAVLFVAVWLSGIWNDCGPIKGNCLDKAGCRLILVPALLVLTFGIQGIHEIWRKCFWKDDAEESIPPLFLRTSPGYGARKLGLTDDEDKSEKFDVGRLPETAYNVAFFAVGGTLFALLEMQAALSSWIRITLSLWFGLIYPAGIILGLARSTAAAAKNYCVPPWMFIRKDKDGKWILPKDRNGKARQPRWLKRHFTVYWP